MYYWLAGSVVDSNDTLVARHDGPGLGPDYVGRPLKSTWIKRHLSVISGVQCNIISYQPGAVVCDEVAKSKLEKFVGDEVEFLPVELGIEGEFYFINVINIIDCLNKEESKFKLFSDGSVMKIQEYVFFEERLENVYLFKIPETAMKEILCTEKFRRLINDLGLSGGKCYPLNY